MKNSIIYFSIAMLLGVSLVYFPSLSGAVVLNQDEEPTNLLSKLWTAGRTVKLNNSYSDKQRILKIDARGNTLKLILRAGANGNSYYTTDLTEYTTRISKDTLIIQMKGNASFYISNNGSMEKIIVNHAKDYINSALPREDLAIVLDKGSNINFEQKSELSSTTQNLQLTLRDKSTLNLDNGKLKNIAADLSDAELNYSNKLAVDSAFVNLHGRSIVKSTEAASLQELKTLVLAGNKEFFKAALIGKNVNLILQN